MQCLQINEDGIISFGKPFNVPTPQSLPLNGIHKIIAPYWDDVDTIKSGKIFYRQTTDPILLARATSEISAAFPDSGSITIQHLLIATWYRVEAPYSWSYYLIDKVKKKHYKPVHIVLDTLYTLCWIHNTHCAGYIVHIVLDTLYTLCWIHCTHCAGHIVHIVLDVWHNIQ